MLEISCASCGELRLKQEATYVVRVAGFVKLSLFHHQLGFFAHHLVAR